MKIDEIFYIRLLFHFYVFVLSHGVKINCIILIIHSSIYLLHGAVLKVSLIAKIEVRLNLKNFSIVKGRLNIMAIVALCITSSQSHIEHLYSKTNRYEIGEKKMKYFYTYVCKEGRV